MEDARTEDKQTVKQTASADCPKDTPGAVTTKAAGAIQPGFGSSSFAVDKPSEASVFHAELSSQHDSKYFWQDFSL